jgi:hypothetical protein
MMRKVLALVLSLLWVAPASAQIIGTLPFTLQNGSIADANQVMSDLNTIVAAVNANAANAGVNTNINALNNLTTPLVYTSGGTSNYSGGGSGGSANAQTIASPIPSGFTLATGKSVTFVAGFTNSGPATLAVAATAATNVFKQGASGPVALSGGELTVGNLVTATFDGTQYQIANPSPQSLVPACTSIDWTGAVGPSGYLLENGAAVLRASFTTLFGCITVQGVAATTSSGSPSVVVPNSALFQIGWSVGGTNVTCNSTISAIPDGTHITISANAGGNGATTLTIGPYPQGDCSTTFNLPQMTGRATLMRDTGGSVVTSSTCTNPASQGSNCGNATETLTVAQLPTGLVGNNSGSFGITTAATSTSLYGGSTVGSITGGGALPGPTPGTGATYATGLPASGTVAAGTIAIQITNTSGTPHPILPPVALVDKYIKF